jgi:hypothetical protein
MTMSDFDTHPDDEEAGYFRMRFRYGPKDLLRAEGYIPGKPIDHVGTWGTEATSGVGKAQDPVRADEQGTSKRKAVRLDDGEDIGNGREVVKPSQKKTGNAQKEPAATSSELEKLRVSTVV